MEYQYCENMQCHSNTSHAWMHYHPMPCITNCTSFGGHFFLSIAELHLICVLKYLKGSSDKIKGTAGGFLCSSQAWGVEDRFQTTPPQGWSKILAINSQLFCHQQHQYLFVLKGHHCKRSRFLLGNESHRGESDECLWSASQSLTIRACCICSPRNIQIWEQNIRTCVSGKWSLSSFCTAEFQRLRDGKDDLNSTDTKKAQKYWHQKLFMLIALVLIALVLVIQWV